MLKLSFSKYFDHTICLKNCFYFCFGYLVLGPLQQPTHFTKLNLQAILTRLQTILIAPNYNRFLFILSINVPFTWSSIYGNMRRTVPGREDYDAIP